MTKEEAIDVLKHNYPSSCFEDLCEAVEIAIQALSADPDNDMIHLQKEQAYLQGWEEGREVLKQTAIDAIHEIKHIDCEGWETIDEIEECLKQLPSAQEQKKEKMTNREYLDGLSNMDFAILFIVNF